MAALRLTPTQIRALRWLSRTPEQPPQSPLFPWPYGFSRRTWNSLRRLGFVDFHVGTPPHRIFLTTAGRKLRPGRPDTPFL